MPNKEGRWVTINGRAIFIGEGQSLEEALNSKGQSKRAPVKKTDNSHKPGTSREAANLKVAQRHRDAIDKLSQSSNIGFRIDPESLKKIPDSQLRGVEASLRAISQGNGTDDDYLDVAEFCSPNSRYLQEEYFKSAFFKELERRRI